MMNDKDYIMNSGLIEQYVLGLTSPEESKEVERYAEIYPEIKQEIHAMGQAMEEYAKQFSIPAPKGVKNAILTEIKGMERELPATKRGIGIGGPFNLLTLASMAAAVLLGFFYLQSRSNSNSTQEKLNLVQTEFFEYKKVCQENQARQAEQGKLFALFKDKSTIPVRLKGTSLAPQAEAIVYLNTKSQSAYLNIVNLPKPPADKQYQIWADVKGEMINMGVFNTDSTELQSLSFIANAESLNITLEPLGGSKHPTVELLYVNGKV